MRIVCPSCDATYEVPKSLLGADARMVRCARCGKEWEPEWPREAAPVAAETPRPMPATETAGQVPPRPAAEPRPATGLGERLGARARRPPVPEAMQQEANDSLLRVSLLSRRMQVISAAAWLASAAVLAAAVATFFAKQPSIQVIFPASERLYRLFGMS